MEKLETGLKLVPVAGLVLSSLEQVPVLNFEGDFSTTAKDCVNLLRAGFNLVQVIDGRLPHRDHYFEKLLQTIELLQLPGERIQFTEGDLQGDVAVHKVTRKYHAPEESEE